MEEKKAELMTAEAVGGLTMNDLQQLVKPLAETLQGLGNHQADVAKQQISADLQKHSKMHERVMKQDTRSFAFSVMVLAITTLGVGGLFFAQQYQLATHVLAAIGGALGGFGYGRYAKQSSN